MLKIKATNNQAKKWQLILFGALLGAAAFMIIYGIDVINVTKDGWILAGYDERDIIQRYTGWLNYRNAPWTFPLATSPNIAYPGSCNIAFMDSIPIVAVFFKLFSGILPATFQYEGICMFAIFILQGVAAALLINEFVSSRLYIFVGTLFFLFSPILMERGFRHTSLSAHYIVLFAMYLFFKYRKNILAGDEKAKLPWVQMLILSGLSVGITPYFLPMVMIFVLLLSADNFFFRKKFVSSAIFFTSNCVFAVFVGVILGTLGGGVSPTARGGYGEFSMNLNAPFNPYSLGGYNWSTILPEFKSGGKYDGFNYLGFGMILFITFAIIACIIMIARSPKPKETIKCAVKKYGLLFLACIFLTLFAITNVVFLGDTNLFTIPLPGFIISLGGIFRGSGRLFYPVYYLMFLFALVTCYKFFKGKKHIALIVTVCFLALQVFDLSGVIYEKHVKMNTLMEYEYCGAPELLELNDYSTLVNITNFGGRYGFYISGKNNMKTNFNDANSGDYTAAAELEQAELENLENGILNKDYVYVTPDDRQYPWWQEKFADEADFYWWKGSQYKDSKDILYFFDMMFMVPKK